MIRRIVGCVLALSVAIVGIRISCAPPPYAYQILCKHTDYGAFEPLVSRDGETLDYRHGWCWDGINPRLLWIAECRIERGDRSVPGVDMNADPLTVAECQAYCSRRGNMRSLSGDYREPNVPGGTRSCTVSVLCICENPRDAYSARKKRTCFPNGDEPPQTLIAAET